MDNGSEKNKRPSDKEIDLAVSVIKQHIEPRFEKIVGALNDMLARHGIRAGLDISWVFDKIEGEKK